MQPDRAKKETAAPEKSNELEPLLNEQLLFRIIMNNVPDKIYFKNLKSEFISVNKNLADFFGLKSSADAIGKTDFDFFSIEHARLAFEDEKKIIDTGEPLVGVEEKETWPDGRITWASTTKMPLKDEKGEIIGTFGISRDITLQKNAEESLRKKDIMVTKLAENVPGVIYQFQYFPDRKTCFPYASEGISTIFGVTPDSVKNDASPVFKVIHPDDLMPVFQSIREAYQNFAIWKSDFRIVTPENEIRWLTGEAKPEKQPDHSVLWYGYIHDITEKKESERKVENAFQRIRHIMNSVQAGIILVRKSDCVVVDSNPAVEKITGLKQHQFLNKKCNTFLCPALEGNCPAIDLGQHIENSERKIKNVDGKLIPILKNVTEIEIEGEIYLLESFVDISAQKEAEEQMIEAKMQAEAANKAKSEFLANMSHEIRTPMNSILGFSEVMLNTVKDEKQIGYLKTILNSGKTLLSLINDILDLSKIEAGKMEISPAPTDLSVLIHEIRDIFTQKIKEKNIELFVEDDPFFPGSIFIDEIRMRQIVLNIVGNAVKFTSEGHVTIKLRTDRKNDETIDFTIAVSDTGIGIPESDQKRIFESFSQQSGQTSRQFEGTGLGLSISQRLCELMGGKIELDSETGIGSTFSLIFNGIEYSNEKIIHEEQFSWSDKEIIFSHSKILIVDDVDYNRDLVKSYLENHNFTIIEAENGEKAITKATEVQPDIILMDIRMPVMNGYEATQLLKSDIETASIPVIALTASTMSSETDKINQYFDGYLRKPIQRNLLLTELARHLEHETRVNFESGFQPENDNEKNTGLDTEISADIKNEFRELISERIEELESTMIIEDMESFVEFLMEFAVKHNLNNLKNNATTLKEYINEFEFDKISSR
ncbi:MAG: PAS domain S-box protein, partial [Draconibacterium sp.]